MSLRSRSKEIETALAFLVLIAFAGLMFGDDKAHAFEGKPHRELLYLGLLLIVGSLVLAKYSFDHWSHNPWFGFLYGWGVAAGIVAVVAQRKGYRL